MTKAYRNSLKLLISLLIAVVVGLLIKLFLIDVIVLRDSSLSPQLVAGDRIVVDRLALGVKLPQFTAKSPYIRLSDGAGVHKGSYLLFRVPNEQISQPIDSKDLALARVAAVAGDTVCYSLESDELGSVSFVIPRAGMRLKLSEESVAIYRQLIKFQEGVAVDFKGDSWYINGVKSYFYTFKQDYCWLEHIKSHEPIGWVPHSHLVGKPRWVLYSFVFEEGFNFKRTLLPVNP